MSEQVLSQLDLKLLTGGNQAFVSTLYMFKARTLPCRCHRVSPQRLRGKTSHLHGPVQFRAVLIPVAVMVTVISTSPVTMIISMAVSMVISSIVVSMVVSSMAVSMAVSSMAVSSMAPL
ncbi:hypothetical protein INR49_022061 [Caranx melampygus]|nr:hypothetical protein INR49_022061 [Caranx melampygus]